MSACATSNAATKSTPKSTESTEPSTASVGEMEPSAPVPPPSSTGGGPGIEGVSREAARDRLARAICNHYRTCAEIGPGAKHETLNACVSELRARIDKDQRLQACGIVDVPKLNKCVGAIDAKVCGVPIGAPPAECDDTALCAASNSPGF